MNVVKVFSQALGLIHVIVLSADKWNFQDLAHNLADIYQNT